MKNKTMIIVLGAFLSSQLLFANTINILVSGMVCAFCAQGITKKFKGEPAVKDVHVDLDKKIVSVNTKEGQDIGDDAIKKDITDSGFNVVEIKRGGP